MNQFLQIGDLYASNSTWKDFALTKVCLCAMGILMGMTVPKSKRRAAGAVAGVVFLLSYAVLMAKLFALLLKKKD